MPPTARAASRGNKSYEHSIVVDMLKDEHEEQDPSSTIALEFKRACTLFAQTADEMKANVVSQLGVVSFWTLWEKSMTLDIVHCLAPFTPDTIGAPHRLKHQILGFLGDRLAEQNPPGLMVPTNIFATGRGRAPALDILSQQWGATEDMTEFLPATTDIVMLAGIPYLCYIPKAWVPMFIHDTWNPPATLAWIATELAQWPPDDRDELIPIFNWLRLACMKQGRTAAVSHTSTLALDWKVVLADREYLKWSKKCLDSIFGPVTPAVTAPSPTQHLAPMGNSSTRNPAATTSPMNAINLQDQFFECLATSFLYLQNKNTSATSKAADTTTSKGFLATEKVRMLGWCGLTLETDNKIPPIWTEIHAETSKNGKKAVLVRRPRHRHPD
jgi:hypothetical protein